MDVPVVYHVPCEYGAIYVCLMGRTENIWIKERWRLVRLGQEVDKSAIAQHCWQFEPKLQFKDTSV